MPNLPAAILNSIKTALDEDIGPGDITTQAIVPPTAIMTGEIIAKQNGVIAGLDVAKQTFLLLDPQVQFTALVAEGTQVKNQQIVATVSGLAHALLMGERTALNFLGRMSGIATLTQQYVSAVAGTAAKILDTRKTAPGLRQIDKLAVKRGGGQNHRLGLHDMILIKDNHIDYTSSLAEAVKRARAAQTNTKIEVETRSLADVREALNLGVSHILLDNMSLAEVTAAVQLNQHRAKLEASGNVSLQNVRKIAETGVDYISIGALTHSVTTFDVSFLWAKIEAKN